MAKDAKRLLRDATWDLLSNQGIKACKVQDICSKAGLSKMTFYYYFNNKYDVIDQVLKAFFEDALERSESIILSNDPFHDKIMQILHWKADLIKELSPQFLQELYSSEGKFVDYMKDSMLKTQKLMFDFFNEGILTGEINKSLDLEVIMFWINAVFNLMIEGEFDHLFDDPREMNRQIRDLILYGILGNNNEEVH
ncbi:MAG: TetR/AcrR family transcriptional regulator [Candidatus Neomarinimicrobiota bacterium]